MKVKNRTSCEVVKMFKGDILHKALVTLAWP